MLTKFKTKFVLLTFVLINTASIAQTNVILTQDIYPGSNGSGASNYCVATNYAYFMADDGQRGYELWKTDGFSATLVKDINPGVNSSYPGYLTGGQNNMIYYNRKLYFSADDGEHGYEMWVYDELSQNTYMLKDIYPGTESGVSVNSSPDSKHNNMALLNGEVFFAGTDKIHGTELWKTNGSANGTQLVKNINTKVEISNPDTIVYSSYPEYLTVCDNKLFFSATDRINGYELWESDGTPSGTKMVKDIATGFTYVSTDDTIGNDSYPKQLFDFNGQLYFTANAGETWNGVNWVGYGNEVWMHFPFTNATNMVLDINPGTSGSDAHNFTLNGNKLFFTAYTPTEGVELWGTGPGNSSVVLIGDIYPGPTSSNPLYLTSVGNTLFFSATDANKGNELWEYKLFGSSFSIKDDIYTGSASSSPMYLTACDGRLYFSADHPSYGRELWACSEGGGSYMVENIYTGSGGSYPNYLTDLNGILILSAERQGYGFEPNRVGINSSSLNDLGNTKAIYFYENKITALYAGEIEIYNLNGQQVYKNEQVNLYDYIDLNFLTKGLYLCKTITKDKTTTTLKVNINK